MLKIGLAIICEAYELRGITSIIWISGKENPANDLTKTDRRSGVLSKVVETNCFLSEAESRMTCDEKEVQIIDQ